MELNFHSVNQVLASPSRKGRPMPVAQHGQEVAAKRLGTNTLDSLPAAVGRPRYDRTALKPGILHLGAGAFHRCHQAEWTDDALEAEFGAWGIIDVNLRPPDLATLHGGQDGLFCRELRDTGLCERRLVGSVIETITVLDSADLSRALEAGAGNHIRVITMTVTEKGYCHIPATGELNPHHPDILHDISNPASPVSVPGFVLEVLRLRRDRGVPWPTILSCDNVPDNGATLRRCVIGLARLIDPALAEAVERDGRFLNTMVDRIVPATRDSDLAAFTAEIGIRDEGLVVGEPFRMWVIEDKHKSALPAWGKTGAMIVDDVAPFELMKMRVLNGIQTNVSALGLIGGIPFMSDVMASETFRRFARKTMLREVLPGLPPVPGIDLEAYVEQSIQRLQNPELRHSTAQIVTDGSQKIRQRLLEPIRACARLSIAPHGLYLGLAAWMQTASGADLIGNPHTATDPLHERTRAVGRAAAGRAGDLVRGLLAIEDIFGEDFARNEPAVEALTYWLVLLRERGVDAALHRASHA
jgi:fructuronate reductase